MVTAAFTVFLPPMLVADTQLQVIDKLNKFEQKNIEKIASIPFHFGFDDRNQIVQKSLADSHDQHDCRNLQLVHLKE